MGDTIYAATIFNAGAYIVAYGRQCAVKLEQTNES